MDAKSNLQVLEDLKKIASIIPAPVYWNDINSVVLGANELMLQAIGCPSLDNIIGKTLHDMYSKEIADHIKTHNEEVMRTGRMLAQEEMIEDFITGQIRYFSAVKAPLYNDDGEVIGTVGTATEITAEKEAERLRVEIALQKQQAIQRQAQFTKIARQVAHDIRSPLASLLMVVKSCTELPEAERIALREVALSINGIANYLLSQLTEYRTIEIEQPVPVLTSVALLTLLIAKKYEYQNKWSVTLDYAIDPSAYFAFISIVPSAFERMLSNLVNNAIKAVDGVEEGDVTLKLEADDATVSITVEDHGKGMPPDLLNQIFNSGSDSVEHAQWHGTGLTQIHDTLQRHQGVLAIHSVVGQGTTIVVTFPRVSSPAWIAQDLQLTRSDMVIILDDDQSIHSAWDMRFVSILQQAPLIQLKHFVLAQCALQFIESLTPAEKQKIYLLADYELLNQDVNGLQVIEKCDVQRTILVTSHYANQEVRQQAAQIGARILPKQLAADFPIVLLDEVVSSAAGGCAEEVIVIVDDDKRFINALVRFTFAGKIVDRYTHPEHFLDNISEYNKNTRIYLDNHFKNSQLKGVQIAKQLHKLGYTSLYLLSGGPLVAETLPDDVVFILKDDLAAIKYSIDPHAPQSDEG